MSNSILSNIPIIQENYTNEFSFMTNETKEEKKCKKVYIDINNITDLSKKNDDYELFKDNYPRFKEYACMKNFYKTMKYNTDFFKTIYIMEFHKEYYDKCVIDDINALNDSEYIIINDYHDEAKQI
jgi:hypothetical protein